MTQQTTITDENGRAAEVRDSDPTAASRALVVRVVGLLGALSGAATEATLADVLNELVALRAGYNLEDVLRYLDTIAEQQRNGQSTSIVGPNGVGNITVNALQYAAALGLAGPSALAVASPTEVGAIGFQSSVTTNATIAVAVGRRIQRVLVVGAPTGVQPTISLSGTFGWTAQPVPRSTLLTVEVKGRHSNGGVNVTTTNTTFVGVETTG
jgi:hypothetical protein